MKRHYVSAYIMVAVVLSLTAPLTANVSFEPVFNPHMTASPTSEKINIDGDLSDPGWRLATRADQFHERNPGELLEPPVRTEVYVTYDKDNFYVAFVCHDNPDELRATMCQRDQFYNDDCVCLLLDTYSEGAWAYEFFVNPYGIQKDKLWSSVAGEDESFDLIWQSSAMTTDSGYQVEMAIPFSSLRFPGKSEHNWKIDFWRSRPRESFYQYSWAAYTRDEHCWTCQWGSIDGIRQVSSGHGLELLPTLVANQSGRLNNRHDPNSGFSNSDVLGEFSLGSKYNISSNMSAEVTYNPDFSQIEADAAQIDVNTTFALFFPERRPFFQEGADLFRTMFNSFYTRTINDPKFAGKLISRSEKTSYAFVSAVDENSPYTIPLREGTITLNSGNSYVNILRAFHSVGSNSHIGFFASDRRYEQDGSGTIGAFDMDLRLTKNIGIAGQYILSHTREPNDTAETSGFNGITFDHGKHTVDFDGESYYGNAMVSHIHFQTRNIYAQIGYNQISPTYRTQTGYDPINSHRTGSAYLGYTFYPKNSIITRHGPSFNFFRRWEFDGPIRLTNYNVEYNASLRMFQTSIGMGHERGSEVWLGEQFEDLYNLRFWTRSRFSSRLAYSFFARYGHGVARYDMDIGQETSFDLSLYFKPTDRIIIEPGIEFAQSKDIETDSEFYRGYIFRSRLQYQVNRQISVRLITQYNDFRDRWDIDPLLTYRINSFTVFYFGSTYDYDHLENEIENRKGWHMSSRQFFMKIQYLLHV
jgi:hypothetical protein